MRYLFIILPLLAALPFHTSAHASANWCAPDSAPSIDIRTSTDQVSYNFSLSEKSLNNFEVSTVNPYASNVITDVGGLMKGGIETKQKTSYGTMTNYQTNEVCFWHERMEVEIHIKPTIYVASEFPQGSCMFNAIMEHEQKHVLVDREIVNKYASLMGQAIRNDMTAHRIYGPVPLSQQQSLQRQLNARMETLLNNFTNQMSAERRKRQQAVDSLNEYERINHLCPEQMKQRKQHSRKTGNN